MRLDANIIKHQVDNLRATNPELLEDEDAWLVSLESQTDALEFLSMLVRKIGESDALSQGTCEYIDALRARARRVERRIDTLRSLAFKIMEAAELKKAELPEATLSIRNGTQKVVVMDEQEIPFTYVRIKREPDKTKIKDALLSGEDVPGVVLSNGEATLSIRVK